MEQGFDPCPASPCEYCAGDSATVDHFEDGKPVYMTSWEWCQRMKACAASIDWDKVFGR